MSLKMFLSNLFFPQVQLDGINLFLCHSTALPRLELLLPKASVLVFLSACSPPQHFMTHEFNLPDCCKGKKSKSVSLLWFSPYPPCKIFRKIAKSNIYWRKGISFAHETLWEKIYFNLKKKKNLYIKETSRIQGRGGYFKDITGIN